MRVQCEASEPQCLSHLAAPTVVSGCVCTENRIWLSCWREEQRMLLLINSAPCYGLPHRMHEQCFASRLASPFPHLCFREPISSSNTPRRRTRQGWPGLARTPRGLGRTKQITRHKKELEAKSRVKKRLCKQNQRNRAKYTNRGEKER